MEPALFNMPLLLILHVIHTGLLTFIILFLPLKTLVFGTIDLNSFNIGSKIPEVWTCLISLFTWISGPLHGTFFKAYFFCFFVCLFILISFSKVSLSGFPDGLVVKNPLLHDLVTEQQCKILTTGKTGWRGVYENSVYNFL